MKVFLAYSSVVLIWATTPLAIHWSNTDFSYTAALAWRMVLAASIGSIVLKALGFRFIEHKRDVQNFVAGALGLFPTMLFVYWAAQSLPSGLMSVIFGFFPFAAGVWTQLLYRENIFTRTRVLALLVALTGLVVINIDQLRIHVDGARGVIDGADGVWAVGAILIATSLWALSSVWLKHLPPLPPLRQSVGSAMLVMPAFGAVLLLESNALPAEVGVKSIVGVAYLVVAGSLLGHTLFFFVLRHCSVSTVALIPLITPVLALLLGWFLEGEPMSFTGLLGAALVVFALAVYQGVCAMFIRGRVRRFDVARLFGSEAGR